MDRPFLFSDLTPHQFLATYWQQQSLLLNQLNVKMDMLNRDWVFDLATQADAEVRLVLEKDGDYPWQVIDGPFEPADLTDLPPSHWTILIQECNRLDRRLNRWLDAVRFLPFWRLDDIMISYSPDQGSVGAHVDQYDVFLIQAVGQKHWQINPDITSSAPLIPDLDMKILEQFSAKQEWMVEPGSALYLPPDVAHYGRSIGESLTVSIGFRAPSAQELWMRMTQYLQESGNRFRDAKRPEAQTPGIINADDVDHLKRLMANPLEHPPEISFLLGQVLSAPNRGGQPVDRDNPLSPSEFEKKVKKTGFYLVPGIPAMVVNGWHGLFMDGRFFKGDGVDDKWIQTVADHQFLDQQVLESMDDHQLTWLYGLYVDGLLELTNHK